MRLGKVSLNKEMWVVTKTLLSLVDPKETSAAPCKCKKKNVEHRKRRISESVKLNLFEMDDSIL